MSHEKAEQIRARIACTPAERGLTHMRSMCVGVAETGLGGRESNMCADESKDFRQPSPAGEGVSHRLTDEVLSLA